jgi:DNA (cytosine-5)-methyltransferase 1
MQNEKLKELSLFSGAGGGLLASKYLLGWETLGYVEWEDYPQRVLAQRIKDGLLDEAPIFGDIRTFISEGYAKEYKGMVDVVSGGFPCQPFSCAGKQAGENDPRNMWPSTCKVIDIIRPTFAFLENVPGLISCGYLGNILQGLDEIGYNAKWMCLSSENCGALHKRERLWILAYPSSIRWEELGEQIPFFKKSRNEHRKATFGDPSKCFRITDGMADRVDRLKAIGNGQTPIVAATAWNILKGNYAI